MDSLYILCGVVTVIGILVGIVIGYYKSRAEFARDYVSKDDCEDCSMKKQVNELAENLDKGSEVFSAIKVDIILIKVKLGIKTEVEELKAAIATIENAA